MPVSSHSGMAPLKDPATIEDTAQTILGANDKRAGAFFYNAGSNTIWLAFGRAAEPNKCYPLLAGAIYEMLPRKNLTQNFVSAVCAAGTTSTLVYGEYLG